MSFDRISNILVVDDDQSLLLSMRTLLVPRYSVDTATTATHALQLLESKNIDVVFLDILLPDMNGLALLKTIKLRFPETEVVMLTALREIKHAVTAMQNGAFHYFNKDFLPEEILVILDKIREKRRDRREIISLRSEVAEINNKEMILGNSEACQKLRELVHQIADLPSTVLIQGESGTGKELLARAIHNLSKHKNEPFITLNVASLPKHLVESELFGHERGAFTGAHTQRIGKFELAEGGVLFLDEVGEIDLDVQVKLLRFLQEGEFERVGGNRLMRVNSRLIAATNRNLTQAVRDNCFRKDLYYRLNVIPITLPPLRERKEDIPMLAALFLDRYCKRFGKAPMYLTAEAERALKNYSWPGNIRELEHLIERIVATTNRKLIDLADVPVEYSLMSIDNVEDLMGEREVSETALEKGGYYKKATSLFEKNLINKVLVKTGGNRRKTAEQLGIPLSTLKFKMQKLGMNADEKRI